MAKGVGSEDQSRISGVVLIAVPESGLESLTKFFSGLPDGLQAAFVLAISGHGGAIGGLREIIGRTSGLKVKPVKQKDRLEPDTVHILPADRISSLKKSRFAIEQKKGVHKGPVDSFLLSLANDQGDKAIGIILSGLNVEGTLGLTALKEAGGLVLTELSDGVSRDGIVDHLLPAEKISQRLTSHLVHRLQATIEELESRNEELKSSNEDHQRRLLGKLQHRVKNILAVVRSLANRTAERAENLEDFTAHFEGRLSAMGRIQNIVTRTAEGSVDLAELVHDELVGHVAHYSDQVDVDGPEIELRAKPAQTLSLAIHELTTNAVKYGALSTPSGHIRVSWRIMAAADNPRLAFEWVETGVPVIDQEPARNGFGRELIERGLPYELNANTALEFRQGGVRCVMELPLDDKVIVRQEEGPDGGT